MDPRRQRLFSEDNFAPFEVCRIEAARESRNASAERHDKGFNRLNKSRSVRLAHFSLCTFFCLFLPRAD